jgi:hypothetical protein
MDKLNGYWFILLSFNFGGYTISTRCHFNYTQFPRCCQMDYTQFPGCQDDLPLLNKKKFQPHWWVVGIDVDAFSEDDLQTKFQLHLTNAIGNQTLLVRIYHGEHYIP